jgi:hypothetical protein
MGLVQNTTSVRVMRDRPNPAVLSTTAAKLIVQPLLALGKSEGQSEHGAIGDGHADTITRPKITSQIYPGKNESNRKHRHYLLLKNFTRSPDDDRKEGAWSREGHHENDQVADVDAIH